MVRALQGAMFVVMVLAVAGFQVLLGHPWDAWWIAFAVLVGGGATITLLDWMTGEI